MKYNNTFTTAFYDIGRGKWGSYNRTVDDYLNYYAATVSKIKSNLVVYCDESNRDRISSIRPEDDNTKIVTMPFEETEMYRKHYSRTNWVMKSDGYRSSIIHQDIPEMLYPEYNIINFNKISFVQMSMNLFDTPVYGWIDFGFGHGKVDVSCDLSFCEKVTEGDKIYMGCLRIPVGEMLYNPWSYFSNEIFITGSAFVGTKKSINTFHDLIGDVIEQSLDRNLIDDDQTIYNMAYLSKPDMFNLRRGRWFNQFEALCEGI